MPSDRIQYQLHQLKTVYLDFSVILELIKTNYKFDDENTPDILMQLEKTLNTLSEEICMIEKEAKR